MMSSVRVRSFFALGIVLAVVARGVDGRIECSKSSSSGRYYVADRDKCRVDTMNKRFGGDEKLMNKCYSDGRVSCCSVVVDARCAPLGVWGRTRIRTCLFVRACVQPTSLHSPKPVSIFAQK